MLKGGILHPQLRSLMGRLRHMDTLVIADAGLPVPAGVERVDLGWRPGDPAYLDEHATFAEEALTVSPEFHKKALALLPEGCPVDYLPHTELKKQTEKAMAIVLTGEFTPYTNVILRCGCAY